MIGNEHLRILAVLDTPMRRQELVEALDYAPKTISNQLGDLEALGLIERERDGNRTEIRPVETACLRAYHSLVKSHAHVDFPELLSKSTMVLLYYLTDEWRRIDRLIEDSGLSEATVYRQLKALTNRAIVLKRHGEYRLSDEFGELHTFVTELSRLKHRRRISNDARGGVIVWERHDEFLVRSDHAIEKTAYHPTGLAAFDEYGLRFLTTPEQYSFYSPSLSSLTPPHLVCHLLLIENDARHRAYALLLLAETSPEPEELRRCARHYGVDDVVEEMSSYLRTQGEESAAHLPPWSEFRSLASDYGVTV